jgi:hypothetical protein
MSSQRTIQYNSSREITTNRKAAMQALAGGLEEAESASNGVSVDAISAHYGMVPDGSGGEEKAFVASVNLSMETTLANEDADRETLAQVAVDLGYDPDLSTAREQIELA